MSNDKNRRISDVATGPGTLISEGCRFEGALTGNGNFMINGEFDGDCDVTGSVQLAKNGHWKGTIRATTVIIAGTVDGDIHARGQVEIGNTAKISGTVSGEAIAVSEGAVVEGVMKTTGRSAPQEFIEKRQDEEQGEPADES